MNFKKIIKKGLLKIKGHFKKIIAFKKSPHSIALGFSVGSLIALLPTFGLGYFFGLGVLLLFPKLNKISLFLGLVYWNPFLLAPIYGYSYKLGSYIVGDLPVDVFKLSFNSDIFRVSLRFLLGNIIISLSISIILYFTLFFAIKYFRGKKSEDQIN